MGYTIPLTFLLNNPLFESHTHADIDECKEGTHNCSNFAGCISMPGGYNCECYTIFEGDGMICTGTIRIILL